MSDIARRAWIGAALAVPTIVVVVAALVPRTLPWEGSDEGAIREYLATTWRRPPALEGGAAGKAFDHYDRAILRLAAAFDEIEDTLDPEMWEAVEAADRIARAFPGSELDVPAALEPLLGPDSPLFTELILGARTELVSPPSWLFDMDSGIDHGLVHEAIRRARASAAIAARAGRPEVAVDRLGAADRMGRDLADCGNLLGCLVGLSTSRQCGKSLADLVSAGLLPDGEIARVEESLRASRDFAFSRRRVFRAERLGARSAYREGWSWAGSSPTREILSYLEIRDDGWGFDRWDLIRLWRTWSALEARVRDAPDPIEAISKERKLARLGRSEVGTAAELVKVSAGVWPRLVSFAQERRTACEGALLGIRLHRSGIPVEEWAEELPTGWGIRPFTDDDGRRYLALYPPGAAANDWAFRMPDGD